MYPISSDEERRKADKAASMEATALWNGLGKLAWSEFEDMTHQEALALLMDRQRHLKNIEALHRIVQAQREELERLKRGPQ